MNAYQVNRCYLSYEILSKEYIPLVADVHQFWDLTPKIFSQVGLSKSSLPVPQGESDGAQDLIKNNEANTSAKIHKIAFIIYPFGSIPRFCNSERPSSLSQFARLTPSLLASLSNCSFSSGVMRILNCGDCPSPLGLLSRLIVDKWSPIELVLIFIGGHLNTVKPIKSTPPNNATNTIRGLTTSDTKTIEVAMKDHTTPLTGRNSHTQNIVFIWRFAECKANKAIYHLATAHTEDEARSMLPNPSLVFTARIRLGVPHA